MNYVKYSLRFGMLNKNCTFRLGGTTWVKKSSRTARTAESPNRVFYFSQGDVVSISVLENQTLGDFIHSKPLHSFN